MISQQTLERLRGAPLATVRQHVRETLEAAPSFNALAADERKTIANSLVNVMSYLVHPSGGDDQLRDVARRHDVAHALADDKNTPVVTPRQQTQQSQKERDAVHGRLAEKPGQVGNEMKGKVAGSVGSIAGNLVKEVDFPKFVSSLIEGVFTSIVNSSIKQMHEFGKYLQMVSMTVKEFAAEKVDPNEARQQLVSQNPNALELDHSGDSPRVRQKSGADDDIMPDFKALFGLEDDVDIDDEEDEAKVVESQQLQMARQRQQMLATMVLMGINRIVVTDGEIKATVTFDVQGRETAARTATAGMEDRQTHMDSASAYKYNRENSFWGTDASGSGSHASEVNTRISTAVANTEDKSTAELEAKAKMTGFVHVKFKSETFPLERFASQVEMEAVQDRSRR
jgi:hypothetical protein